MKVEINHDRSSLIIEDGSGRTLIKDGKDLLFNGRLITGEFYSLVNVPFSFHVTIRFTNHLKNPNHTGERQKFLNEYIKSLNSQVKGKYPDLESGKTTVNYVAVDEFGASTNNNVHLHILFHIHPKALARVKDDVWDRLNRLRDAAPPVFESVDVQHITMQDGMVSYFAKVEKGRREDFKQFYFAYDFINKIRKFYPKNG